jgi:hypothetical protein
MASTHQNYEEKAHGRGATPAAKSGITASLSGRPTQHDPNIPTK